MNEIEELKEVLRVTLSRLKEKGVTDQDIAELIKVERQRVSRLKVTSDLQLLLVDYRAEIKLEPLHRAIYLLFLRHPEGIRYKELPDYREELAAIYHSMKRNTQARKKVERSIIDVTDPLCHSIIEKCGRINSIIRHTIPIDVAGEYMIQGEKGEIRRISLDRNLLVWENERG